MKWTKSPRREFKIRQLLKLNHPLHPGWLMNPMDPRTLRLKSLKILKGLKTHLKKQIPVTVRRDVSGIFLARGDLDSSESSPQSEVTSDSSKGTKPEKTRSTDKDAQSSDSHYLSQELMSFDFYRKLRSNKEQVLKIIGGLVGALFIIAGLIYILGSPVRVADNVVAGERAVISAFLILVGVLIIAGVFARRLLEKSFLKNIHSELEEAEAPDSEKKITG